MERFSESDYSNSPEPLSPEPEGYDYSEAESSSPEVLIFDLLKNASVYIFECAIFYLFCNMS